MANIDAKLKISDIDFDNIKQNLKAFLGSQTEFSDYNFEGSGLSVLLDVLAYNTHYMSYYLNMVANEMFIDSAVARPSVVSHAKLLGYIPRSRVASQALVDIAFQEVVGGSNSAMTIPRFTRFATSAKDGVNYIFVNSDQRVASRNSAGYFNFTDLMIKEGQPVAYTFLYDQATNAKQIFELPDLGIDTSTIQVQVQTSALNGTQERFELVTDSVDVVSTDAAIFYIEENRNGKYQIYFGDNIIGKALTSGNIVVVSYVVTSGSDANGIKSFRLADNIKSGSPVTITVKSESFSGKLEEDIESIRFTAPKSYISQNRAVTKNDYIALLNKNYPYFDSVTVWGGEENYPPQYGKIFFSAKPRGNYEITQSEVEFVKENVLAPVSILTVTPEYVPADYNYLMFRSFVTFDQRKTSRTAGEIQTLVYNAIINFNNKYFNTFNSSFRISKLIRAIDDADPSIENNLIEVYIEKRFRPKLGQSSSYTIDFNVPLLRGTSIQRLTSQPSFTLLDDLNIERDCYLEEIPQSFSGVESIEITSPGSGYTDIPEITINGDGEGAEAYAIIVNGTVRSIRVTKSGSGYTSAIVTINGGNGVGARAIAVMEGKIGKIRSYYYDSNSIKTVLNDDAGVIYYDDGRVELTNFAPVSVNDAYGTMTLKASPATNAFSTKRNCILTLDVTDPAAIEVQISNSES